MFENFIEILQELDTNYIGLFVKNFGEPKEKLYKNFKQIFRKFKVIFSKTVKKVL